MATATRKSAKRAVKKAATAKRSAKTSTKKTAAKKTPVKKTTARKAGTAPGKAALAEYNAKRDFSKTKEPAGKVPRGKARTLHFVIQKHAASHLHYDLRLELDGVMKS